VTLAGWIFMVLSWAVLITLSGYCFRKILKGGW